MVETPLGGMGLLICYDVRFPEAARLLALQGAEIILVPAAFNRVTGPPHWELTLQPRALDNQVFVVGASPPRDDTASYVAFGHSLVVDPWGEVVARGERERRLSMPPWIERSCWRSGETYPFSTTGEGTSILYPSGGPSSDSPKRISRTSPDAILLVKPTAVPFCKRKSRPPTLWGIG